MLSGSGFAADGIGFFFAERTFFCQDVQDVVCSLCLCDVGQKKGAQLEGGDG
jgi:hypothetical protein